MSISFDLDPVDRLTAGAVGEPGSRIFFIQAQQGDTMVTLLAEKQQVQVLAQTLGQLLASLEAMVDEPGEPPSPADMQLRGPLEPEWRVGSMSIEMDESTGMLVLIGEEVVEEGPEDEPEAIPARARFVATLAQMQALAAHAEEVCSAGRPRCQMCGFPLEPEGHACPAQNGHRKSEP